MALDRFILFDGKPVPSMADLTKVALALLGGAGSVTGAYTGCVIVTLPGRPSHPLRDFNPNCQAMYDQREERFFEIVRGEETVDVITRTADPFTNALAAEYADTVSRWFEGKEEY